MCERGEGVESTHWKFLTIMDMFFFAELIQFVSVAIVTTFAPEYVENFIQTVFGTDVDKKVS